MPGMKNPPTTTTSTTTRINTLKKAKEKLAKKMIDLKREIKKLEAEAAKEGAPDQKFVYDETLRAFVKNPKGTHKFTMIYWHFLSGHPKQYSQVKEFFGQESLKVIMPLAPVYNSLYFGQEKEGQGLLKKTRLWADYYLTTDPWSIFAEDDSHGANAEEHELDTDEETEFEKHKAEHKKKKGRKKIGEPDEFTIADFHNLCMANAEDEDEDGSEDEAEADGEGEGDANEGTQEAEQPPEDYEKVLAEISDNAHPELEIPKQAQVQKRIEESVRLIKSEVAVLNGDSKKLFLGGWSQGAVIALLAALDKDCPSLGGVLGICPTLHPIQVDRAVSDTNKKDTQFHLYLGTKDTTYPVKLLEPLIKKLRDGGYQDKFELEYHDMDHSLDGLTIDTKEIESSEVEEMWINKYIRTHVYGYAQ